MTQSVPMSRRDIALGVNIDHVATLRQARGTRFPDPVQAAFEAEQAGADGITIHLREDRRHIQDRDVYLLRDTLQTRMNLEMALTDEMLAVACKVKPEHCCLVPENRAELTTEGGLDVSGNMDRIKSAVARLAEKDIQVSLFIDPDPVQINAAAAVGAPVVEIHTGGYADAENEDDAKRELERIAQSVEYARTLDLVVNAGHGLNYHNVRPIAALDPINELNIGHSIICRALFVGLHNAVSEMKRLMSEGRRE